jgi:hypothetical protein
MSKQKSSRIWTNRDFPDGKSVEWIEKINGGFFWKADDYSFPGMDCVSCGFPVDEEFVKEKFKETGREYIVK